MTEPILTQHDSAGKTPPELTLGPCVAVPASLFDTPEDLFAVTIGEPKYPGSDFSPGDMALVRRTSEVAPMSQAIVCVSVRGAAPIITRMFHCGICVTLGYQGAQTYTPDEVTVIGKVIGRIWEKQDA